MKNPGRGAENIKQFNEQRERIFIPLIQNELQICKKRKMQFRSLGSLAEYIGSATNIHRTTLTRNPRYKILLATHFANQRGSVSEGSDDEVTQDILKARLLAHRLETSNLKEKVKRLEAFVKRSSESNVLEARSLPVVTQGQNDYVAFVDTAMVLVALLERLKDTVTVNLAKQTLEDLSAPPSKRIIIGPERMKAFIEWEQENGFLRLGFSDND